MVGLTYTPPLVPAVQIARGLGQSDSVPFILSVLSGAATGAVGDSLADTLAVATGPGNVLTGTVTSASPGGNFTLTTAADAEITLHYPPELPIDIGSTVTLRILTTGITPQATILSIDGRSVLSKAQAPSGSPAPAPNNPAAPGTASTQGASLPLPGSGNASAYAASVAALLTLEIEIPPAEEPSTTSTATSGAETDPPIDPDTGAASAVADADAAPRLIVGPAVATLLRPAAVAFGQQPLAVGTRYLLTLTEADTDPASANPYDSTNPDSADWPLEDLPEFTPQAATLAGRVMPPLKFGELIIETGLGTLAVATDESAAVGTAVKLTIGAVAPPLVTLSPANPVTPSAPGLIDQALAVLRAASPGLAEQTADLLLLPTGESLLAASWKYLADPRGRAGTKEAMAEIRKGLLDAGRSDLAERLEIAATFIGEVRPQRMADGWLMTTLPFLGLASQEPVRLYVRGDDGNPKDQEHDRGERLIVEVKLKRLGPMQFEGLARDRRLDLVIRTGEPLERGLIGVIEGAFRDAIESCGCAGEISFGRMVRFPFAAPEPVPAAVTFDA